MGKNRIAKIVSHGIANGTVSQGLNDDLNTKLINNEGPEVLVRTEQERERWCFMWELMWEPTSKCWNRVEIL